MKHLAYVKALSQGLPILCAKGQGVDGLFKTKVGIASNPNSTKHILKSIEQLVFNSTVFKENVTDIDFNTFSWENIYKSHCQKM